ncbi:MAG TPA: hypothetical protein VN494_00105 [Patescibacteria group bacterium]|nr:hypothetical protein [Patescibacteria group bacterium]
MSDFLDNLFDRHSDAMPQITPRLPSIFEPEVSRSGLDLAVKEEAATPEETDILRQPSPAAQPVGLPTVAEPVRPIVSPAPTVPVEEENPSVKVGLNKPVFPRSPLETPTLPPPSQGGDEERAREPGLDERFPQPFATLIAPLRGRVRHARQEERIQHRSPTLKATAREQLSVKVDLNSPTFSLAPRETSILLPSSQGEGSLQGGDEERARILNQGFLNPPTPLIVPVIPTGPERPMSQPEPVINVTIGRIEVRATVSQQKQTPKPESRTAVMGLEEYLRRRSGGQDR